MLNPSRPDHKNLGEEDSSGSDAGSEVSLEPGTDRFGFILTNGSAAGNVGPSPELVRQREAKWINIIDQWDHIVLKKTTSKVKVQSQKGIPASLRSKCWPLLCGAADRMKQNKNLYQSLDSQPALQSWVDVIERDLDRQFPFHEMFLSRDGHGQRGLFRVLKAYTQYQPEEGYCQAQGPVAAVLLMNMLAEEAFWCLVQISEQYLPGYYSPLLEGVLFDAVMLNWLLKKTCPAVYKHLQHYGVEPLMFATDWLMCLFTRHLPFNTLLRVWDLFFCYGVRVLFQVAVVLVRRVLGRADQRKRCQGQMETLERLRAVREQVQEEDDAFIAEVCSVPLSARDLERQTQKELQKWRKDRPSSTFDPRSRCQGYHMAWARVQENVKERDRTERVEGNLSVPQDRSAFRHSLSPSLLQKRRRKGSKGNTGDCEGSSRVERNHSFGAKVWNSWTDLHLKKNRDVKEEEELSSDEDQELWPKLTEEREQNELIKTKNLSVSQITPTEHLKETEKSEDKAETLQMERTKAGEDGKSKGKDESKYEQTQVEEESVQHSPNVQSDGQPLQALEDTSVNKHREAVGSHPSQVSGQQSLTREDNEIKDRDIKTQEECDLIAATEETRTEIKKNNVNNTKKEVDTEDGEDTSDGQIVQADMKQVETENVQQIVANVTNVREEAELQKTRETSGSSEADTDMEAVQIPDLIAEKNVQEENVIPEASKSLHNDPSDVIKKSCESMAEMTEDTHIQTETENVECQKLFEGNTATRTESEPDLQMTAGKDFDFHTELREMETSTQSSSECFKQSEGNVVSADTDDELETSVTQGEIKQMKEETTQFSDKEGETTVCEDTRVKEQICLHAQATLNTDTIICNHMQIEETPTEFQTDTETVDSNSPSAQHRAVKLEAEPEETASAIPEKTAPEKDTVDYEESVENVKENTGEGDVFIISQTTDRPDPAEKPQVQNKDDCDVVKCEVEHINSKLKTGHGSSQSSGDICVRKSPRSRGKRTARRLSEDLFTAPQHIHHSQSICNYTNKNEHSSGTTNQNQTHAGDSQDTESVKTKQEINPTVLAEGSSDLRGAQEKQSLLDPAKRFGLFRRLREEQPKKPKGTPTPKMQVPKILIQDFSDVGVMEKPAEVAVGEEKKSSRERRRRRREQERQQKEKERLKKKREKDLENQKVQERRKPQTRGKSFQVQRERSCTDVHHTDLQTLRHSASYTESYF